MISFNTHLGKQIIGSIFLAIMPWYIFPMDEMELPSICATAHALYMQREKDSKKIRRDDPSDTKKLEPNSLELAIVTEQETPHMSITCLYPTYEAYDQGQEKLPTPRCTDTCLEAQLISIIEYRSARSNPLTLADTYAQFPFLEMERDYLIGCTQHHRMATAEHEYLWPEACVGDYDRHLLRPEYIQFKELELGCITLNQPIIRQWAQDDPKAPIKRCFELLCIINTTLKNQLT